MSVTNITEAAPIEDENDLNATLVTDYNPVPSNVTDDDFNSSSITNLPWGMNTTELWNATYNDTATDYNPVPSNATDDDFNSSSITNLPWGMNTTELWNATYNNTENDSATSIPFSPLTNNNNNTNIPSSLWNTSTVPPSFTPTSSIPTSSPSHSPIRKQSPIAVDNTLKKINYPSRITFKTTVVGDSPQDVEKDARQKSSDLLRSWLRYGRDEGYSFWDDQDLPTVFTAIDSKDKCIGADICNDVYSVIRIPHDDPAKTNKEQILSFSQEFAENVETEMVYFHPQIYHTPRMQMDITGMDVNDPSVTVRDLSKLETDLVEYWNRFFFSDYQFPVRIQSVRVLTNTHSNGIGDGESKEKKRHSRHHQIGLPTRFLTEKQPDESSQVEIIITAECHVPPQLIHFMKHIQSSLEEGQQQSKESELLYQILSLNKVFAGITQLTIRTQTSNSPMVVSSPTTTPYPSISLSPSITATTKPPIIVQIGRPDRDNVDGNWGGVIVFGSLLLGVFCAAAFFSYRDNWKQRIKLRKVHPTASAQI